MYFAPREFPLRNGQTATFRGPLPTDAASDLACMRTTFAETDFLLHLPEEVNPDEARHAAALQSAANDPNTLLLFCVVNGEVVARMHGSINPLKKVRHRFRLGVSVMQEYWSLGIATLLMNAAEEVARTLSCTQMELEVMAHNIRARALYERLGYRIVQVRPDAIRLADGQLIDEYLMIKKL